MSDPTLYLTGDQIDTAYKDWTGSPCIGPRVGGPLTPIGFADLYPTHGVVVRDDLFEGTVGVPYSLKTHAPGQVIASFVTNSNYAQAVARGVSFNVVMNGVMKDVPGHSDFILGDRIYYSAWRLRGLTRHSVTGAIFGSLFVGGGVGADGVALTGMYHAGSEYVLSADFTVGATSGNRAWQLEVGFGTAANANATFDQLDASPEWPAFTLPVPTSE